MTGQDVTAGANETLRAREAAHSVADALEAITGALRAADGMPDSGSILRMSSESTRLVSVLWEIHDSRSLAGAAPAVPSGDFDCCAHGTGHDVAGVAL